MPSVRSLDSSAERRQVADAIAAFDRLRERGTEVLLLFGEQEALYQEFARHGLLDQLDRWPNLRLERIPSRDQMFRAQWLQRARARARGRGARAHRWRGFPPTPSNGLIEEMSA